MKQLRRVGSERQIRSTSVVLVRKFSWTCSQRKRRELPNHHTCGLSIFQQRYSTQAPVGANTDDCARAFRLDCKFLYGLTQNTRASRREGMTECHAAAVRVHPIAGKTSERVLDPCLVPNKVFVFETFDVTKHLGRECLVNFPQCDVIKGQIVACEKPWNCRDRRH